ncbi:MAG: aldo/keto reductase [Rhodoferax sp.]|nr:aldo/keto reductase [Rhodoferax sp.]
MAGVPVGTARTRALGLGGAALGNLFTAITDDAAHAVITVAIADGCRSFDTAPHYGNGLSEQRFGRALRQLPRDDFVLSTKVGRVLTADASAPRAQHGYVDVLPFAQHWDYSAAGVRRSVEDSLQRLGLARLDVAYVHDCDAETHGAAYPQVLHQVLTEALPELRRLQAEGLLRHIGLGVNDVAVCLDVLRAADIDCLLLAGRYSLLDHAALAELLPVCTQRGVRIAVGGVFNSGILATGVREAMRTGAEVRFNYGPASSEWVRRTAAIEAVCEIFGVPLRAAALQFPLAHPAVEIVMAGPQTTAHWQDAVAMVSHVVPSAFWQALRDAQLIPAMAPAPA